MIDPTLLLPQPAHIDITGERWQLPERLIIDAEAMGPVSNDLDPILDRLAGELSRRGVELVFSSADADLRWRVAAAEVGEAYELSITADGIDVAASQTVGLFRAMTTLIQWLRLHPPGRGLVCGVRITDRPSVPRRGILLDISRNRVPRMAWLYAMIDLMVELKLNELQLYVEHTFAYRGHERVWRGASPMRAGQMRRLEAYARRRFVELVPNQNSFGHMHRWLVHEPYRRLAECPQGIIHPWCSEPEPFSLCPTDPGSLELLDDLYSQLLPNFRSPFMNAGLDETLDLGRCRSKSVCQERGVERVYLDFLHQVRDLAAQHGKRLMFWADVILGRSELIKELPSDSLPMVWGYDADHDFASACEPIADAGLPLYLCPGTATWCSFSGRLETAVANLALAAREGARFGATGYLITDWGDFGHLQPPSISWPTYVAGASFAWNARLAKSPSDLDLPALLDHHVLRTRSGEAGRGLCDLGRAQETVPGGDATNGTALFYAWIFADKPFAERRSDALDRSGLEAMADKLSQALELLRSATMDRPDADLITAEAAWTLDALDLASSLAAARLQHGVDTPVEDLPAAVRRVLLHKLDACGETLRPLWLARSRVGGLERSIERLGHLRPRLVDC